MHEFIQSHALASAESLQEAAIALYKFVIKPLSQAHAHETDPIFEWQWFEMDEDQKLILSNLYRTALKEHGNSVKTAKFLMKNLMLPLVDEVQRRHLLEAKDHKVSQVAAFRLYHER